MVSAVQSVLAAGQLAKQQLLGVDEQQLFDESVEALLESISSSERLNATIDGADHFIDGTITEAKTKISETQQAVTEKISETQQAVTEKISETQQALAASVSESAHARSARASVAEAASSLARARAAVLAFAATAPAAAAEWAGAKARGVRGGANTRFGSGIALLAAQVDACVDWVIALVAPRAAAA